MRMVRYTSFSGHYLYVNLTVTVEERILVAARYTMLFKSLLLVLTAFVLCACYTEAVTFFGSSWFFWEKNGFYFENKIISKIRYVF
jgi:hypothetical protein